MLLSQGLHFKILRSKGRKGGTERERSENAISDRGDRERTTELLIKDTDKRWADHGNYGLP